MRLQMTAGSAAAAVLALGSVVLMQALSCGRRRPASRPRRRRCLLKGCEERFHPPQARPRYCSELCRKAARKWSRWNAQQRHREKAAGQPKRSSQKPAACAYIQPVRCSWSFTAAGASRGVAEPLSRQDGGRAENRDGDRAVYRALIGDVLKRINARTRRSRFSPGT
jgi:hypothetical protein